MIKNILLLPSFSVLVLYFLIKTADALDVSVISVTKSGQGKDFWQKIYKSQFDVGKIFLTIDFLFYYVLKPPGALLRSALDLDWEPKLAIAMFSS